MIGIRAAAVGDIPAIAGIIEMTDESVAWPDVPGWPYVEHTVARARVVVATLDDEVIGFAGAIDIGRPEVRFLTDLFVLPERQDHGTGGALLEAAMNGAMERMTFSSADPRAIARYIRAGMRPWWPLLYLDVPRAALGDAGEKAALDIEPSDVATTAALSLAWTGMDRTVDFAYYANLPGGAGHVIRGRDGKAAGVVWSTRRQNATGRVAAHASFSPEADPVAAGLAVLRAAVGDEGRLTAHIPGPHPVVAGILARGARIEDRDTFCATDPSLIDPARMFPNPAKV